MMEENEGSQGEAKKEYRPPVLCKRENLAEVTEGGAAVIPITDGGRRGN